LALSPVPLSNYRSLSTLKPTNSATQSLAINNNLSVNTNSKADLKEGVSVFNIEPPVLQPSAVASGSAYQYKQMADMLDLRTNWIDGAVDYLSLNGTQGSPITGLQRFLWNGRCLCALTKE
jgi:hypothetical protein